jgi:uncharacterized protein (TIGR02266 family)
MSRWTGEKFPWNGERRATRVDVEVPVRFRTRRGTGTGVTKNIGAGGLFVATLRPVPVGDRVVVRATIPGDSAPVEFLAEVRWSRSFQDLDDRPAGLGLRFVDTPMRAPLFATRGSRAPVSRA